MKNHECVPGPNGCRVCEAERIAAEHRQRERFIQGTGDEPHFPDANTAQQIGGEHYRVHGTTLQHWDVVRLFKLDYFQGQVTKYVMRWRDKNGVEDLRKAAHYLAKYIEIADAHEPIPGFHGQTADNPLLITRKQANDPEYRLPKGVRYVRVQGEDLVMTATKFDALGEDMRRFGLGEGGVRETVGNDDAIDPSARQEWTDGPITDETLRRIINADNLAGYFSHTRELARLLLEARNG